MSDIRIKKGIFEVRISFSDDLDDYAISSFVKLERNKIVFDIDVSIEDDHDPFTTIVHELAHMVQGIHERYPDLKERVACFMEYAVDGLRTALFNGHERKL